MYIFLTNTNKTISKKKNIYNNKKTNSNSTISHKNHNKRIK